MDPSELQGRLIRLKEDIESDRFKGRDLTEAKAVWGQAAKNFEQNNFGIAEELANMAYGLLYAPDSQRSPSARQQAPVVPVYVYVPESDRLSQFAGEFMNMTLNIILRPSKVFDLLTRMKALEETLMYYVAFGVVFSLVYMSMLSSFGLSLSIIQSLPIFAVGGFLICVASSYLEHQAVRSFKGEGALNKTAAVFGFSLVPVIISCLFVLYLRHATSFFSGKGLVELAPGIAIASVVILIGSGWSILLQVIGLRTVHGLDREKGLFAAGISVVASAVLAAVIGAAAYLMGGPVDLL